MKAVNNVRQFSSGIVKFFLSFVIVFNYFPFTMFKEKIKNIDNTSPSVSAQSVRPFHHQRDDFVVVCVTEHRRCWHVSFTKVKGGDDDAGLKSLLP